MNTDVIFKVLTILIIPLVGFMYKRLEGRIKECDLERTKLVDPLKPVIRDNVQVVSTIKVGFMKSMYVDLSGVEYFKTQFAVNSR